MTGKRIDFRELPELGGWAAALWLELDDRQVILESTPASEYHKRWVRTHEYGHIVFSHLGWVVPPTHSSHDPRLKTPELVEAARTHRMRLCLPLEQAAEEFARHANRAIRSSNAGALESGVSEVLF